MDRLRYAGILLGLLTICFAGCCCVQGGASCGDCGIGGGLGGALGAACRSGDCGGNCGGGPVASLASCRGACGEVYVDEWLSEPPTPDNCGYDCGGCGQCGQCRPIRSILRLLWGRPYVTNCSTGFCGPSCDGGCSSCDGGVVEHYGDAVVSGGGNCASGNCGGSSGPAMQTTPQPLPPNSNTIQVMPEANLGPSPIPGSAPEVVVPMESGDGMPTPAPSMNDGSASRFNPAQRRKTMRRVSARNP